MSKCYLLGTVLAAALMAAPGIAAAQNNNGNPNWNNHTSSFYNGNNVNRGYSNNAGNFGTSMEYANVGQGGYTGMAMPLRNGNNNNNNNNAENQRPSQRNPLLADNGDVRASKFIGTTVHNDRDQNIGSIDDVLIGRNGVWAVISTNNKKVAVPFQDFVVGNSDANGDDKLVLPNATQARLNTLPVFHYDATNYANNNGNGGGWFSNNNNNNGNGWNNNNNRNNPGLFGNGSVRNNNNG